MKHRLTPFRFWSTAILAATLGLGTGAALAGDGNSDAKSTENTSKKPKIAAPGDVVMGLTYGEWGARWAQLAQSVPVSRNPLADSTGEHCGEQQLGSMWILSSFLDPGTVRECAIPAQKSLYINVLGFWCANIGSDYSEQELRECATSSLDGFLDIAEIYVEIDGYVVPDLLGYRATSGLYYATLPDDNIYQYFGTEAPAGTYSSFVIDAVGLLVSPLKAGNHEVRFFGTVFGDPYEFTYELTVAG